MFIFKAILLGAITGFSTSLPPGPATMESVKNTLNSGFWAGLKVSAGSIVANYFYLLLLHFGLNKVLNSSRNIEGIFWIYSGIILIIFNQYSQNRSKKSFENGNNEISSQKFSTFIAGFLITFLDPSNPSIWLALSATVMKDWQQNGTLFYYIALLSMLGATIIWFTLINVVAAISSEKLKEKNLNRKASNLIYYILWILSIGFIISGIFTLLNINIKL